MRTTKRTSQPIEMAFSAFLFAASLAGCTHAPDDELPVGSQKIAGGERDRGTPSVVLLFAWDAFDPVGTLNTCTANVVAPDVLLTAAHCFQSNQQYYAAYLGDEGKELGTPIDPGSPNVRSQLHMVSEVHPHPQYVTTAGYYDVGIVVLQEPLVGVPALPILRTVPSASMLANVSIVGYGKTYDGDTSFAVTKHRADGLTATLDATHTMTVGDSFRHACVGDSGGPVLADVDGVTTIIGTDSYSDETGGPSRCRIASRYQRVDPYLDFLDQFIPPWGTESDAGVDAGAGDAGPDGTSGDASVDASPDAEVDGSVWGSDDGFDAGRTHDAAGIADAGGLGSTGGTGNTEGTGGTGDGDGGAMASVDAGPLNATTGWTAIEDSAGGGCSMASGPSGLSAPGGPGLIMLAVCLVWLSTAPGSGASRRSVRSRV